MFEDRINPKEAAVIVGREVTTLSWWRSTGQGPDYYKDGRRVFYLRKDVEAYRDSLITHP
ncbi:helix-turn-helix domain-containing protein [Corynebacterium sp.]|uniref:helix-turn-helix transcriptional regulator n=1 Tax=Corynebacterium sp. TaxID=1720 RepID=UPI0028AE3049|nr:helix-turn-helix domain-containing protein [Corynebacterium sp.]